MLFKLLIAFTFVSTIKTISTNSLVGLQLKVPVGSSVINATLTDVNGNQKYFIQELISSSGSLIEGKISISGEKESYSIHYHAASDTGAASKERLVIHGTSCLLFIHENSWDKTLPGIDKPLLNLILLLGPSILYRLDYSSFVWTPVADKNVRGIMMKGATTEMNKRLKITYYYKSHFDELTGLKNPSQIKFSGYDPDSSSYPAKENLILDIIFNSEFDADLFQNEVQPLPGIGCPRYLSEDKPLPSLRVQHLHYTIDERTQGSTKSRTRSEIHAAQSYNFLRVKTLLSGSTSETIYDYKLGISILIGEDRSCAVTSIDSRTTGMNQDSQFTLAELFMLDATFKYLGKLKLEHRDGIPVEAWESIRTDTLIDGKKVDKAVITQYFIETQNLDILDDAKDDMFYGYALVSTKISIYKYDPLKKVYTLTDGITRDYMNFQEVRFEKSFASSLSQCDYLTSDERLTINFILECDASHFSHDSCIKHTEDRVTWLKGDFTHFVLAAKPVSILRIEDIQYRFTDTKVEMQVTFLDLPHLEFIFNAKSKSVSQETLAKMRKIKAANEAECLGRLSEFQESIEIAIYRSSDLLCGYLSDASDFKEDSKLGQQCDVYLFPLNNLHRIKEELTLDQIHGAYKQDVGRKYDLFTGKDALSFKLIDVIDVKKKETLASLVTRIKHGEKLKIDSQSSSTVSGVKTFSDCYRACHDAEELQCNIFSFCDNEGQIECIVSDLQSSDNDLDVHIEPGKKCSIFAQNIINDYSKIVNRKFKNPFTIGTEKDLQSCAESCHASSECVSFQYCDGSCSFGDLYRDSSTQYDTECMIFTPKMSEKYQRTGNRIISDVLYTETNLNLDQCAALCDEVSEGDETGCKSFNYCPKSKTESSCSLTHFSVKSSDAKTTQGGHCSNYELKVESNGKKSKESSSTKTLKGTSRSGAFGIIMLFLFLGALLGFISPFAYNKIKQLRDASKSSENFTWATLEQQENIL